MTGRMTRGKRAAAALLAVLLAAVCLVPAAAVNDTGLVVEKLSFRDVLRLYTADRASFGTDALARDENGVTNAAKSLAELFAYTVGLNYNGEGLNANYFGKDITRKMDAEPYVAANLLATYSVEIYPYRSRAKALPEGQTTSIRVYLVGYRNAANGVEPVLHYVWQDNGTWYAVKDDNPYYRVSYNGQSARDCAMTLVQSHTANGTASLSAWTSLSAAQEDGGIVQLKNGTLLAGQGTANLFGVTANAEALSQTGGLSEELVAVSDFVQGDTTVTTGPLVFARDCYLDGTFHRLTDGEGLKAGNTYRYRVVFDEALDVARDSRREDISLHVVSQSSGEERELDFVWYGAAEYLTSDRYNPHAIDFTFTPTGEEQGVCTFSLLHMVGADSRVRAAQFHACVAGAAVSSTRETARTSAPIDTPRTEDVPEVLSGSAEIPAAETAGIPEAGAEPESGEDAVPAEEITTPEEAPEETPEEIPEEVPGETPEEAPEEIPEDKDDAPAEEEVVPETPEASAAPTPAPTPAVTPAPTAVITPEPVTTPSAMTQATSLPLLATAGSGAVLTRGMLAESLWILSGQQITGLSASFTDLPTEYKERQAVIWAAATGLITPRSDGSFGVDLTVTREQAAVVFQRYAALRGTETTATGDLSAWIDGAEISPWAVSAMAWALESGVMAPRGDGRLEGGAPALCGEVTGMIYRLQRV